MTTGRINQVAHRLALDRVPIVGNIDRRAAIPSTKQRQLRLRFFTEPLTLAVPIDVFTANPVGFHANAIPTRVIFGSQLQFPLRDANIKTIKMVESEFTKPKLSLNVFNRRRCRHPGDQHQDITARRHAFNAFCRQQAGPSTVARRCQGTRQLQLSQVGSKLGTATKFSQTSAYTPTCSVRYMYEFGKFDMFTDSRKRENDRNALGGQSVFTGYNIKCLEVPHDTPTRTQSVFTGHNIKCLEVPQDTPTRSLVPHEPLHITNWLHTNSSPACEMQRCIMLTSEPMHITLVPHELIACMRDAALHHVHKRTHAHRTHRWHTSSVHHLHAKYSVRAKESKERQNQP